MKRLSKYEIACMIERLPGNVTWSLNSMMSIYFQNYSRQELVDRYNHLVSSRGLSLSTIA